MDSEYISAGRWFGFFLYVIACLDTPESVAAILTLVYLAVTNFVASPDASIG